MGHTTGSRRGALPFRSVHRKRRSAASYVPSVATVVPRLHVLMRLLSPCALLAALSLPTSIGGRCCSRVRVAAVLFSIWRAASLSNCAWTDATAQRSGSMGSPRPSPSRVAFHMRSFDSRTERVA